MRHFNSLIFEENVSPGGAAMTTVTSQDWAQRLAQWDQVAYWIWIDNITGSGNIGFTVQHSADGRNFANKLALANYTIGSQTNPFTIQDVLFTSIMSFGYVQILIAVPATVTNAHIKIFATARDQGGR